MTNPEEAQITTAIAAIRKAAKSDLTISRSAVAEIEGHVKSIVGLTKSTEVEREGSYLVSQALGRYGGERESRPAIITGPRLDGAIARFELALRQLGFLPAEREPSPQAPKPPEGTR
jgi:hypothetical protein